MSEAPAKLLVVIERIDMHSWIARLEVDLEVKALLATDSRIALNLLREQELDAVISEAQLAGRNGCELLQQARAINPELPVLVVTKKGSIQEAVELVRAGAHEYHVWPEETEELTDKLRKYLARRRRPSPVESDSGRAARPSLFDMMGRSPQVQRLFSEVARVAPTDFSVLIMGETGSGKEVVAQAIHAASRRASAPLVEVDCGAIPENLIESELFGYEKGAFTGADKARPGRFEAAGHGTVFLDEISNLSLGMQNKLLRALQERRYYRVGGRTPIELNARVIAAANMNLNAAQGPTGFRLDLYHRISEYTLTVPPLRERKADIPFLCQRFIKLTCAELGKSVAGISDEALELLVRHDWRGNVRELRNVVRRAVLWAETDVDVEHLDVRLRDAAGAPVTVPQSAAPEDSGKVTPLKEVLRIVCVAAEKQLLAQMIDKTGGNVAEIARLLEADYKTVHSKLKKYNIQTRFSRRRLEVAAAGTASPSVGQPVAMVR